MSTFAIRNFGCRASQADGAAIAGQLASAGMQSASEETAELVVLNSCTVTATADQDLEKAVRRTRRENPSARILITGCYAQRDPARIASLPGVTWVVGNSHKDQIAAIVTPGTEYHGQIHLQPIGERAEFFSASIEEAPDARSRPNLKIQDGCSNACSFCVIPSVRGRSRSASPEWVLTQVRTLAERYREIVLTGVNLGRWGREWGSGRQFLGILKRILDETPVARIRLSSIEPMDWTDDLLDLIAAEPRIARHVHAPLQSGSDTVLRRMFRKYRPRHYRDRLERAARLLPQAAFGADVLTGFPGETDREFEETVAFLDSLPFTYLHVFTYSERPGTRAADLPDSVPWEIRKERTRRLREWSDHRNLAFRRRLLGSELEVVTMGGREAISSNFVPVELASETAAQQMLRVQAAGVTTAGLSQLPSIL